MTNVLIKGCDVKLDYSLIWSDSKKTIGLRQDIVFYWQNPI